MECVRRRELVMVVGVPFDNLDLDEAAERGLEWLHRMALEPRRLGRRYLSDFFSFTYFSYRQRYHQAWRNLFSPRGVAGDS
jgi:hypothetical protein